MRGVALIILGIATGLAWASDCTRTSTGFVPLNDPSFVAYKGMSGGLYPGGNTRPPAHESRGLALMSQVLPRDRQGNPDLQSGRIVLLSIGMSNATQEYSTFISLAGRDPSKDSRVTLVDGAQGGWSADRIAADGASYWSVVDQRLAAAGVTAAQVQVAWMKNADAGPTLAFPGDSQKLQSELLQNLQTARARFPNLRLMYLSTRIYAGYATTNLNPEPFAYESGFSVKWLIEQQIEGSPDLSIDDGKAPWLSWGPYLWADGMNTRLDGLYWACADLQTDGTHPSASGQAKVAQMLLDFFKNDSTARLWFVRPAGSPDPCDCNRDGQIGVSDIQTIINQVLGVSGFPPVADLNHDGKVDASDIQIEMGVVLGTASCPN